jgi:hypothetical protein
VHEFHREAAALIVGLSQHYIVSDESAQGFLGRVFGKSDVAGQTLKIIALLRQDLEDRLLTEG